MIKDKLGVYRVGEFKFYNKLEAIKMHSRSGIHPHWDFNEDVFSCYNWTVEPPEDILELYRKRAQQIRDQYDHIVLMYSGGADSQAILDTFMSNDIKLDEIATFMNYQATGDKDNFLNAEVWRVALPHLEQIKQKHSYLKTRLIDLTTLTLDYYNPDQTTPDWIYDLNNFFTPNCAARDSIGVKVKEWADIINQGKKLCIIWGHEKPRISHVDGRFVFRFLDLIDNGPTVKSIAGQQPYSDELFFWTPDLPELVIKQAHLIKKYLSLPNVTSLPFMTREKSDLAFVVVNGEKWWLSNHGVHSIIYPTWNIDTFTVGKPPSIIASPRDTWFFDIEEQNTIKQLWKSGIQQLGDIIPEYWRNDLDHLGKGLKGCVSRNYWLEK
jgi:hypothetical protein